MERTPFRKWLEQNPHADAGFLFTPHTEAVQRLSRLNRELPSGLEHRPFQVLGYRFGEDLEVIVGRSIPGGVPSKELVLKAFREIKGSALGEDEYRTIEALIEQRNENLVKFRARALDALVVAANLKLQQGVMERGIVAIWQDAGRLSVIRSGDEPELDIVLRELESTARAFRHRVDELLR